jgi:pimeloyl-ACP methyl ester carboxylesterase
MTTATPMRTEQLAAFSQHGRRVVVWRSVCDGAPRAPVVVLGPGFCRRMRHVGAIAFYLAANGAVVYRFDLLDHVGLSEGELPDFGLTSALVSAEAVIEFACAAERTDTVVAVGVSLMSRPLIRLAVSDQRISRLIMLAGVVDVKHTVHRALGGEYLDMREEDLPARVMFERHGIGSVAFHRDAYAADWVSVDRTFEELRQVRCPVVAIQPSDDEWVDVRTVSRLFSAPENRGARYLFELPYGEHMLEKNPVAARIVLTRLTRAVCAADLDALDAYPVQTPSFEDIVELAIAERKRERHAMEKEPAHHEDHVHQSAVGP